MDDLCGKNLTDFNVVVQELYKRLTFCGECNGKLYWYDGTDVLLKKIMRFLPQRTNADRIRAMTDEELANMWYSYVDCGACPMHRECNILPKDCLRLALKWLKEEAVDNGACSADETSEKVQEDE